MHLKTIMILMLNFSWIFFSLYRLMCLVMILCVLLWKFLRIFLGVISVLKEWKFLGVFFWLRNFLGKFFGWIKNLRKFSEFCLWFLWFFLNKIFKYFFKIYHIIDSKIPWLRWVINLQFFLSKLFIAFSYSHILLSKLFLLFLIDLSSSPLFSYIFLIIFSFL